MAFYRFFPGTDAAAKALRSGGVESSAHSKTLGGPIKSETRSFNRLTSLASWRSEYLLRTRLLRSVGRGKPGGSAAISATASGQRSHSKKPGAVLTYYSKLSWMVTNIDAIFTNGKKGPRVIHGAAALGIASASDPTNGKVEKWGLDDHFTLSQFEEVLPGTVPYGLDDTIVCVPNTSDVSHQYGFVTGEGFPGGRTFFRPLNERGGRYLLQHGGTADSSPDLPRVPAQTEAMCTVWIAKSNIVPSLTQGTIGILTGSSLGIVTSYALAAEFSSVYSNGDMTARWVLSPGVPIVDLKVDDAYTKRRKSSGRLLAVALNALGEVFYLRQSPIPMGRRSKVQDLVKDAWLAGRSVQWGMIPETRRTPLHSDASPLTTDKSANYQQFTDDCTGLSYDQLCKLARNTEREFAQTLFDIKDRFGGWDMRRRLEVDFAGMDDAGLGEGVFVIDCGYDEDKSAAVTRYSRIPALAHAKSNSTTSLVAVTAPSASPFGPSFDHSPAGAISETTSMHSTRQSASPTNSQTVDDLQTIKWRSAAFTLPDADDNQITATAVDQSQYASISWVEDPLGGGAGGDQGCDEEAHVTPTSKSRTGDIPGRRARLLAVGTDAGTIILWNMRSSSTSSVAYPLRVIQTQSPKISALALTALYLVHGGSDGLAQAWDPLASALEPIRTLNSRSSGRLPRQIAAAIPPSRHVEYAAVGAIYLDPDPTMLRGVMAFGSLIRYWTYSSTGGHAGRRRRPHQSDAHGRLASRRQSGAVTSYIAAEEAEMRQERDNEDRERAWLQSRFGLGMGLSEDEAIRYAELMSEETFADEQRRLSASDTGSTPDMADTASLPSSTDISPSSTLTPEPSMSGGAIDATRTSLPLQDLGEAGDDGFEQQMQRALRLSLLETEVHSPPTASSGDYDVDFKYKPKKGKASPAVGNSPKLGGGGGRSSSSWHMAGPSASGHHDRPSAGQTAFDDDLELALYLSLQQTEATPPVETLGTLRDNERTEGSDENTGKGKGKGKEVL
jgi:hypothetical protein